jgi:hypothetical protein
MSEIRTKQAVIDVNKEMEKQLTLEKEQADLLQQKVEATKVMDYQQCSELNCSSKENVCLKNKLDHTS